MPQENKRRGMPTNVGIGADKRAVYMGDAASLVGQEFIQLHWRRKKKIRTSKQRVAPAIPCASWSSFCTSGAGCAP